MKNFKDNVETMAKAWEQKGKQDSGLPHTYDFMRALYWAYSSGGKGEDLSALAQEFLKSGGGLTDKMEEILRLREYCSGCGESYRVENLSICTNCENLYCSESFGQHSNGNRLCRCGGELVG